MKTIKRHIALIIDDNEPTRTLLARILDQELDVLSVLAPSCDSALSLARMREFDIILLDLLMPGIGGQALLAEIRQHTPNARTPIVIVSVVGDKATVDACLAAGANAYHHKPVRRADLVATVKAQIASRGKPNTTAR